MWRGRTGPTTHRPRRLLRLSGRFTVGIAPTRHEGDTPQRSILHPGGVSESSTAPTAHRPALRGDHPLAVTGARPVRDVGDHTRAPRCRLPGRGRCRSPRGSPVAGPGSRPDGVTGGSSNPTTARRTVGPHPVACVDRRATSRRQIVRDGRNGTASEARYSGQWSSTHRRSASRRASPR